MGEFAKTQTEAAKKLGVSRATFITMSRCEKGYDLDACREFAKRNARGPYRRGSGGEATAVGGVTLTEAKIRDTLEHAENERIKKERQLVEQAKELGQIVLLDDVQRDFAKIIATVSECSAAVSTAIDRALPDSVPAADAWPALRGRLIEIAEKLPRDIGAAVNDLW